MEETLSRKRLRNNFTLFFKLIMKNSTLSGSIPRLVHYGEPKKRVTSKEQEKQAK